jgi:hypothetical protein
VKSRPPGNAPPHADPEDHLQLPGEIDGNQPVRTLERPKKFHHTLTRLARQVARGAMVLLGRIAAGEPDAFEVVDPISRQDLERRIKTL